MPDNFVFKFYSFSSEEKSYCPWPPCYSHIKLSLKDLFNETSASQKFPPKTSELRDDDLASDSVNGDTPCTNQQILVNSDQTVLIAMGVVFAIIVSALFILLPKWKPGWPKWKSVWPRYH